MKRAFQLPQLSELSTFLVEARRATQMEESRQKKQSSKSKLLLPTLKLTRRKQSQQPELTLELELEETYKMKAETHQQRTLMRTRKISQQTK